ncbi:hypothetical protein [Inmirania thermothiophila]|uniref:Cellulose biosynthesis protein BcsS n=1 Tax=Inmirania thermothiophila TaxID=1750597 RepID=A0A3N1Y8H9_9GAMM|nr:hypothetical protein [Inmirania thermothiophila]ROR35103.1 hypothetical protein EDC57_1020 [Inmirania thermothiophila]
MKARSAALPTLAAVLLAAAAAAPAEPLSADGLAARELFLLRPSAGEATPAGSFELGAELLAPRLAAAPEADPAVDAGAPALTGDAFTLLAGPRASLRLGGFLGGGGELRVWGAEAGYHLRPPGAETFALSLRGGIGGLSEADGGELTSRGVELAVSRDFSLVTPYAGWGRLWLREDGERQPRQDRYFLGARLGLGGLHLDLEGDVGGEAPAYRLRLDWRF